MNSEPFPDLDRVIHERGRLAIVSLLAVRRELSFTELRDLLGMTDGNLITHVRALQEAGYVVVSKLYKERRPQTTCGLTEPGRQAFERYLKQMESIVGRHRPRD